MADPISKKWVLITWNALPALVRMAVKHVWLQIKIPKSVLKEATLELCPYLTSFIAGLQIVSQPINR